MWLHDCGSTADPMQLIECAVDRITPKFVWRHGDRLSHAPRSTNTGMTASTTSRRTSLSVRSASPLAEQAARWEQRKVDILAADEAFRCGFAAVRRSREAIARRLACLLLQSPKGLGMT
jgi:hypothetical protein